MTAQKHPTFFRGHFDDKIGNWKMNRNQRQPDIVRMSFVRDTSPSHKMHKIPSQTNVLFANIVIKSLLINDV